MYSECSKKGVVNMAKDYEELGYLKDLSDPEGENYVPADYNTQDMRNINEKVNRILYGDDSSIKKSDDKVDITKQAPAPYIPPIGTNEIHSYSTPELRKAAEEEAKDFVLSVNENYYDSNNEEKKSESENSPKEKKPLKKKITIISIVVSAIIVCVVLFLVVQAVVMPKSSLLSEMGVIEKDAEPVVIVNKSGEFIFAKGCKVSDVDISGMTVDEAKTALKEKELDARPKMEIKVTVDGDEKTYTEDNFTFTYDTDELLNAEKEFSEKLSKGTTFPVKEDKNGEEYIPEGIKEISAEINESSVEKLVEKIDKKYDVKSRDARVKKFDPDKEDMFTFTEGKSGKDLDKDTLKTKFDEIISSGNYVGEISLKTKIVKPKVTVSFLKENMVLLAEWTTVSTNDANGNQNMDVSLKACDGSVIEPGDVWSFNECTGDSNQTSNGYAPAGVIVNGSYTDGVGGGICQSSTTIYNAAVRSNLGIYERHNHTYPSVYATSGFDAAIDYGNFDLKLQNNSKYQVFLNCYMTDKTLYARFYGIKSDGYDYIDTESENYEIGSSYYRARSYRIYKDKNGKEIDREELPESSYSLQNGHSVQTPDNGNSTYLRNKKVYSNGEVVEIKREEPTTEPKPVPIKPVVVETNPPETEAEETEPEQTKPVQTEPKPTKQEQTKPVQTKPEQTKTEETKPTQAVATQTKPVEEETVATE